MLVESGLPPPTLPCPVYKLPQAIEWTVRTCMCVST